MAELRPGQFQRCELESQQPGRRHRHGPAEPRAMADQLHVEPHSNDAIHLVELPARRLLPPIHQSRELLLPHEHRAAELPEHLDQRAHLWCHRAHDAHSDRHGEGVPRRSQALQDGQGVELDADVAGHGAIFRVDGGERAGDGGN